MIDEITPESIASEIQLLRSDQDFKDVFVLVEGQTDIIFYSRFLNGNRCQLRMVKGKTNVIKALLLREKANDLLCIAIVDADFSHIEGNKPLSANLFYTDKHDIETMIIESPAFEKIINEYLSQKRITYIENKFSDLRSPFLQIASRLAIIRWANENKRLNLSFYLDENKTRTIEWADTIDFEKFNVNFQLLLDKVCQINSNTFPGRLNSICCSYKQKYDLYQLCNGHDILYVILSYLKLKGRREFVKNLETNDFESILRLSYENQYFQKTNLYNLLCNWQNIKGKEILLSK